MDNPYWYLDASVSQAIEPFWACLVFGLALHFLWQAVKKERQNAPQ